MELFSGIFWNSILIIVFFSSLLFKLILFLFSIISFLSKFFSLDNSFFSFVSSIISILKILLSLIFSFKLIFLSSFWILSSSILLILTSFSFFSSFFLNLCLILSNGNFSLLNSFLKFKFSLNKFFWILLIKLLIIISFPMLLLISFEFIPLFISKANFFSFLICITLLSLNSILLLRFLKLFVNIGNCFILLSIIFWGLNKLLFDFWLKLLLVEYKWRTFFSELITLSLLLSFSLLKKPKVLFLLSSDLLTLISFSFKFLLNIFLFSFNFNSESDTNFLCFSEFFNLLWFAFWILSFGSKFLCTISCCLKDTCGSLLILSFELLFLSFVYSGLFFCSFPSSILFFSKTKNNIYNNFLNYKIYYKNNF